MAPSMITNENDLHHFPPQPMPFLHSLFAIRNIIWLKLFPYLLAIVIITLQANRLESTEFKQIERYNRLDGRLIEIEVAQSSLRTSTQIEIASLKLIVKNLRNDLTVMSVRSIKRLVDVPLTLTVSNEVAYDMMMNTNGIFQNEFRTFVSKNHNTRIANVVSEFFAQEYDDAYRPNTLLFNLHLTSKNEGVRFLQHIYFASGNATMESVQHNKTCHFRFINSDYSPPLGEQYRELVFDACNTRPIGRCFSPMVPRSRIRIIQTC